MMGFLSHFLQTSTDSTAVDILFPWLAFQFRLQIQRINMQNNFEPINITANGYPVQLMSFNDSPEQSRCNRKSIHLCIQGMILGKI